MDAITMKLLEKKFNMPMDIIRYEIYPLTEYESITNETIRVAVRLYISNRTECVRRFGPIENWRTQNVTCMNNLFYYCRNFNADISKWDVSNVIDMSHMFDFATSFNADISGWITSNCTDMNNMFFCAKRFNSDISGWNVSNVKSMRSMFWGAIKFDRQHISNWNFRTRVDKIAMFY